MPANPEVPMSYDLDEYIITLDNLAKTKTNFEYATISPETAAISTAKMMQYSNAELKIYEDSLTGDIGEQHPLYKISLSKFLENGKHLKFLLRYEKESKSTFYDYICEISDYFPQQIELRFASTEFTTSLKSIVNKDLNFTVNDVNSYRLEINEHTENLSKSAICNFNDIVMATKLNTLFDKLFYNCSKISLPHLH